MARLILELPDRTNSSLEALAREHNLTVGEILRRSVGLYKFALKQTENSDKQLSLTDSGGKVVANIDLRDPAMKAG